MMTYCGCEFGPALTRELEQSFPNRIFLCSLLLSSYGSSGFLVLCQKNTYIYFFPGVLEFAHIDWSGQKWVEEMLLATSSTCVSCDGAVLWEIDTKPRLHWAKQKAQGGGWSPYNGHIQCPDRHGAWFPSSWGCNLPCCIQCGVPPFFFSASFYQFSLAWDYQRADTFTKNTSPKRLKVTGKLFSLHCSQFCCGALTKQYRKCE